MVCARRSPVCTSAPTLVLFTLILLACQFASADTFFDDFNRPNSSSVGNGWTNTSGNVGGNLAIINNQLSAIAPGGGSAGIYRPFSFTSPVTVSAQIFEEGGFGGLLRRYTSFFSLANDGQLANGYAYFSIVVTRITITRKCACMMAQPWSQLCLHPSNSGLPSILNSLSTPTVESAAR